MHQSNISVYVCMYLYKYVCICICMYIYICMYMYMYVYIVYPLYYWYSPQFEGSSILGGLKLRPLCRVIQPPRKRYSSNHIPRVSTLSLPFTSCFTYN